MTSTVEVSASPWALLTDAETLTRRTSELLTGQLRTASRRKITSVVENRPQLEVTLTVSRQDRVHTDSHLQTRSAAKYSSLVLARNSLFGSIPGTPFEGRQPPLGRFVSVQSAFIDVANELLYVVLTEDVPVLENIVKTMKAISESASSIRGQATIDDFCEGETLVSAPLLFGVSTRIQCRARVMRIYSETDVEVFYIDYGLIQNVPLKDLRLLTAVKLLKIGQLAIPCKLSRSLPQAIVHSMRQTKALKLMFSDEDDDGNVCDFAVGDDSTSCGSNRSDQNRCASNGLYYIKAMLPLPIGDPFTLRYLPRNPPPRGASAE